MVDAGAVAFPPFADVSVTLKVAPSAFVLGGFDNALTRRSAALARVIVSLASRDHAGPVAVPDEHGLGAAAGGEGDRPGRREGLHRLGVDDAVDADLHARRCPSAASAEADVRVTVLEVVEARHR